MASELERITTRNLGQREQSQQRIDANQLQETMKQILPEIGKKVAAGDSVGAFELASQVPGFTQTPAGQQLFKSLFPQEAERQASFQQAKIFNEKTGRTELGTFDPTTGQFVSSGVPAGYAPGVRIDPRTGELIQTTPIGAASNVSTPGQQKVATEAELNEEIPVYQTLNPNQRKRVTALSDKFNTDTKNIQNSFNQISSVRDGIAEAGDNPIAAAQLGARVAKIFEEGRLTDQDVVRYTRRNDIPGAAAAAIKRLTQGTFREQDLAYIEDSINVLEEGLQRQLNKQALQRAKTFTRQSGGKIDPIEIAGIIYGGLNVTSEDRQALDFIKANPDAEETPMIEEVLRAKGLVD